MYSLQSREVSGLHWSIRLQHLLAWQLLPYRRGCTRHVRRRKLLWRNGQCGSNRLHLVPIWSILLHRSDGADSMQPRVLCVAQRVRSVLSMRRRDFPTGSWWHSMQNLHQGLVLLGWCCSSATLPGRHVFQRDWPFDRPALPTRSAWLLGSNGLGAARALSGLWVLLSRPSGR